MSGDEAHGKKASPGRYALSAESQPTRARLPKPPPLPGRRPPLPSTSRKAEPPPSRRDPSVRPPPPPGRRDSRAAPPFGGSDVLDGFDEGSLAHAFDNLMAEGEVSGPGTHETDLTPVRELFAELAASHMRYVRDFMMDLEWGEATRDWIEICLPAVTSLSRAAQRLELPELSEGLERLDKALSEATTSGGRTITGEPKDRIVEAYGTLAALLPAAFALARDRAQREAVIVQTLLLQIPDVRKVTIDKLHAAGVTSLDALFAAKAQDLADVAGIQLSLAERIVERVTAYRDEVEQASPKGARAAEREKLSRLAASLREHHDAYETAAGGWSAEARAEKRARYRAREETWLAITLLLARFGEVETLKGIEKVPFAQRITVLQGWLDDAADRYRSDLGA